MAEDPTTWTELKTSLRAWLSDIDTGGLPDAQLEECIAFAERDFDELIFTPDREAAYSLTADAQSEALPTDFWGFKSGPYIDGSTDTVLQRLEPGDLRATYPDATTGTPAHYAIEGENILFGPTPSSALSIKGTYWQTIPKLASGTATNWLSLLHPHLYFSRALHYAHLFLMDEARAGMWGAKSELIIAQINRVGIMRSANSGPLTASHSFGSIRNIQA